MSKKKKNQIKLILSLKGLNKQININKVTEINLPSTGKEFIYIEKMPSGDWMLAYTSQTIEDIQKLEAIEIVRDQIK